MKKVVFTLCATIVVLYFVHKNASVLSTEKVTVEKTILETASASTPIKNSQTNEIMRSEKMTSSGSEDLVWMERPKWKLAGQLKHKLQDLEGAALNGDHQASYILGSNLRYCYFAPSSPIALEERLDEVVEFSDADKAVSQLTEQFEYCEGIEQVKRSQFFYFLQASANAEYVPAQESFGRIQAEFFMKSQGYTDLNRDEYIERRDNFNQQKIQFLKSAAENGSIRAMIQLSQLYGSQNFGNNGHQKSYLFNQLVLTLIDDSEVYGRYVRVQQNLEAQLSLEERDQAQSQSEIWLQKIKTKGTLYSH